jgi:hypothetical protein
MTMGAVIAPRPYQLVEAEPERGAGAEAEPADPRRQPLERHALARQPDPAGERLVLRKHLEDGVIGRADVVGVTRQRGPAERPLALAEERPDVRRHEARDVERVGHPAELRLGPDVVAVVEDDGAGAHERQHGRDVRRHRRHRACGVVGRVGGPQRGRLGERQAVRHVAVQRIVRRGLVGDDVGPDAPRDERGQHVGRVRAEADRARGALARPPGHAFECLVERVGGLVEVARREAPLDALRIHLHAERTPRRSSWPRAAGRRPCRRGRR